MSPENKSVSLHDAVKLLLEADDIYLLCHQYPDGDTLGRAAALYLGLRQKGKRVSIRCGDPIPQKYDYMFEGIEFPDFEPQFICAVDIADPQLLGQRLSPYAQRVDLCIDHHGSNTKYARQYVIRPEAASTTEIMYDLLFTMEAEITSQIADCIYTGITTDTGCFRYTNATSRTYIVAAHMMDKGADAAMINRVMFDTKSRARLEIERRVLDTMSFYFGGKCAVAYVTREMVRQSGANDEDMDGIAALPRQVEGVEIGVTMREKEDGSFKISVRTGPKVNASKICAEFGGGGHPGAAGCVLTGGVTGAKHQILSAVQKVFEKQENS